MLVGSNLALVVATVNQGCTDVIKNLLSKVRMVPGMAFSIALEKNFQAFDIFLKYDPNQVTSSPIDQTIQSNFDALAKRLAGKVEAISERNLCIIIEAKKQTDGSCCFSMPRIVVKA